ncbi:VOC family protein [Planomonospora venezuelensis]|uniref:Glyoxalase/Bleomycin resistance-like N-terminal domain-containing protein n=1 Tax=Planomonospora venezuelensis TaxID=1999 RepID=A0A841DC91_PLAVE|nr:VOC family protein [Planomonospora venezuelensis]MBB5967741.1 hypothetical protein [Planomonospora venezuelensis]GIN02636.1 glyoxalase [Planomonospora venezuelensis]
MPTQMFVNLPVKDLNASKGFFSALGFSLDERFSDERAACVVIGDDIYAMLLTEDFFAGATSKEIADSHKTAEAIFALGVENRERVDELADAALAAGGSAAGTPMDEGFMYSRGFLDLDGHHWDVFSMDMNAAVPEA